MAGYVGFSKSRNAVQAEKDGLMTASKLGKLLKVSAKTISENLRALEWHHTSCKYNMTNYYSLDQIITDSLRESVDNLKNLRQIFRKQKEKQKQPEGYYIVEYVSSISGCKTLKVPAKCFIDGYALNLCEAPKYFKNFREDWEAIETSKKTFSNF